MGGMSRVSREAQARICEGLGVKLPGPTRRRERGRRRGAEAELKPSRGLRPLPAARPVAEGGFGGRGAQAPPDGPRDGRGGPRRGYETSALGDYVGIASIMLDGPAVGIT
jgi:hypothetical protein